MEASEEEWVNPQKLIRQESYAMQSFNRLNGFSELTHSSLKVSISNRIVLYLKELDYFSHSKCLP